jgi:L-lysine exporter family protein LysE/ArgO
MPVLKGVLLGIGAAAPIGPVNIEIARRTMRGGFHRGFALGCGAVTVDVTYAVLSSLGLSQLLDRHGIAITLSIFGAALLTSLGVLSIRSARAVLKSDTIDLSSAPTPSVHGSYLTGVLMTLFNPMTLAFWLVAVPATLAPDSAVKSLPLTCVGVFIGTIAWVVTFCSILSRIGKRANRYWFATADLAGGVVLLIFAGIGVWHLVRELA